MKRLIISFIAVFFIQMFCIANNAFNVDSTKIEYQIYGNDTLVIKNIMLTPSGKFGCNTISIDIPVNGMQHK